MLKLKITPAPLDPKWSRVQFLWQEGNEWYDAGEIAPPPDVAREIANVALAAGWEVEGY